MSAQKTFQHYAQRADPIGAGLAFNLQPEDRAILFESGAALHVCFTFRRRS
jgi:hypothetical protein